MICKCTTLQFLDPCKTTYLEVTSSLINIGCTLHQNPEEKENEQGQYLDINSYAHKLPDQSHLKPVVFVSKSFSVTECRYADNECELLAVLTGVKRFHYYDYGRTIHLITGYKSLVNIIQKDLAEIPVRLQRLCIRYTNTMWCSITEKTSLCLCHIVYQEILSITKT